MTAESEPGWLGRDGFFRTVETGDAVTELLADPRMHADLLGFFEGMGLGHGEVWDHVAASLLSMNGPGHKQVRAVVAPWFTPRAVDHIRPTAVAEAHRYVDAFVARGACEVVEELATPYVVAVTGNFMGLPPEDVDDYMPLVRLANSRQADPPRRIADFSTGLSGLAAYAKSLIDQPIRSDANDIVSNVAAMVRAGELTEIVGVTFIVSLLSAGNDPTINQFGLAIQVLSERPDVWDALGTGGLQPAPIVEEILRYRPTNQQVSRRASEAFSYDGADFDEGEPVIMRLVSANHDPRRFSCAEQFDPDANRGSHLAFGFGAHYCLGAALARAELQEALGVLTTRLTCPRVVDVRPKPPGGIVGPEHLLISFAAR